LQFVAQTDSILCFDSASYYGAKLHFGFYPPHNDSLWVKIKLDHPFYYDPSQSLILAGDIDALYGEGGEGGRPGVIGTARNTVDSTLPGNGGPTYLRNYYLAFM